MLLVNTFDVEPWWATVPPIYQVNQWDSLQDRSVSYVYDYLNLCDRVGVKCTFFVIGWYANRFPHVLKDIIASGHEIGCHSLNHEDISMLSIEEFFDQTRSAKSMIEEVIGEKINSYRAPSFAISQTQSSNIFRVLIELGFAIDSSVCTAKRIYGGGFSNEQFGHPMLIHKSELGSLIEVPVPGVKKFGSEFQLFGGGYFRLTPELFLKNIIKNETYQVLYLHPHDFDENLPPLPDGSKVMNFRRKLRVGNTLKKVETILRTCVVKSVGQVAEEVRHHGRCSVV